jgi:hypothetical protein
MQPITFILTGVTAEGNTIGVKANCGGGGAGGGHDTVGSGL